MRLISLAIVSGAMLGLTVSAAAQDAYIPGTPQGGAEVQQRYTSPSDSQSVLTATGSNSNVGTTTTATTPIADVAGVEGDGPRGPEANVMMGGVAGSITVSQESIYFGVVPGIHDSLPHIARYQSRADQNGMPNVLTWLGFQPFGDYTRVFIQTGAASRYSVQNSPDGMTLSVRLSDTRISLYNFRRPVDSSWFQGPVHGMIARSSGSDTEVIIELSDDADYTVTQDGEYVFIDFN